MFTEKSLHYFIIAALATTFSSAEAFAESDQKSQLGTSFEFHSSRASSPGFREPSNLDTVRWNQEMSLSLHQSTSAKVDVCAPSKTCNCTLLNVPVATSEDNCHIRLDDNTWLVLDKIIYRDNDFSTTLTPEKSFGPIRIDLATVTKELGHDGAKIIDWYAKNLSDDVTSERVEFESEHTSAYPWRFTGRMKMFVENDAEQPVANVVEKEVAGVLPLYVAVERNGANGELAISIDRERLIEDLT